MMKQGEHIVTDPTPGEGSSNTATFQPSQSPSSSPNEANKKGVRRKSPDELKQDGWKKLSDEDLLNVVIELWDQFGGKKKTIRDELNRRKIMTSGSATWTHQTFDYFLSKHPEVKTKRIERGKPGEEGTEKPTEPAPGHEELIKDQVLRLQSRAPMWKEDLPAEKKTIYGKQELFKRAEEKAKKEKLRTGGNLSSLCAVLLWYYIGCPDDLVETE